MAISSIPEMERVLLGGDGGDGLVLLLPLALGAEKHELLKVLLQGCGHLLLLQRHMILAHFASLRILHGADQHKLVALL